MAECVGNLLNFMLHCLQTLMANSHSILVQRDLCCTWLRVEKIHFWDHSRQLWPHVRGERYRSSRVFEDLPFGYKFRAIPWAHLEHAIMQNSTKMMEGMAHQHRQNASMHTEHCRGNYYILCWTLTWMALKPSRANLKTTPVLDGVRTVVPTNPDIVESDRSTRKATF